MSWRVHAASAIEKWILTEDPTAPVVDSVLYQWLPALEAHGPVVGHPDVGQVVFVEGDYLVLSLPESIGPRLFAETFTADGEELTWVTILSGAHPGAAPDP